MMSITKNKCLLPFLLFSLTGTVFANEERVQVSSVVETSFHHIYRLVSANLHKEYPSLFFKSCESGVGDFYKCGEVPYGEITEGIEKTLVDIKIPAQSFSSGGFPGTFPSTTFPISISRRQEGGAIISEPLFTNNVEDEEDLEKENLTNSYFGRDLYLRMFSHKNQVFVRGCFYAPGVKILSDKRIINFKASKKTDLYLFSFTTSIDVRTEISISPYSFQAMKSCADFQIDAKLVGKSLVYENKIIGISYPQTFGLQKGAINVSVKASGGNLAGSILNFFANNKIEDSIKKSIQSKLGSNINKVDIESGKWVENFTKASYDRLFTKNLAVKLQRALKEDYTSSTSDLGLRASRECIGLTKKLNIPPPIKSKLITDCADFQSLTYETFLSNKESRDLGCYSKFTRITGHDPILKNRSKSLEGCRFDQKVSVSVKPYMKPFASCLLNHFNEHSEVNCSKEIEDLVLQAHL